LFVAGGYLNQNGPSTITSTAESYTPECGGCVGPQGPAGATGPQGPAGIGLVSGAYLELSAGTAAPSGFTKVGTSSLQFKDLSGKNQNVAVDVYRKN
jgi:hypothetical protein